MKIRLTKEHKILIFLISFPIKTDYKLGFAVLGRNFYFETSINNSKLAYFISWQLARFLIFSKICGVIAHISAIIQFFMCAGNTIFKHPLTEKDVVLNSVEIM